MSSQLRVETQTYHCLCSTLLLATPYPLARLSRRAAPSLDHAYVLEIPLLLQPSTVVEPTINGSRNQNTLPSLLSSNLRPARKIIVVRREDGFEKRRIYRCGRCAVCVGYEIVEEHVENERVQEKVKVIYLLEGALVETGRMGLGEGD